MYFPSSKKYFFEALKKTALFLDGMVTLESDLKELNKTVVQIDERGRRIEDMMTMLLQSLSNPPQTLRIENVGLER